MKEKNTQDIQYIVARFTLYTGYTAYETDKTNSLSKKNLSECRRYSTITI